MSLTIVNADTTSPVIPAVPGSQRMAAVKITFDASYPTGGEVITPASVGLLQIDAIISNGLTSGGRMVVPVLAAGVWKLKVLVSPASAAHTHTGPSHTHDTTVTGEAETATSTAAGTGASGSSGAISAGGLSELANTTDIATETLLALVVGK